MLLSLILWTFFSDTVLAASLPRRSESIGSLAAGPISTSNLLSPANIPAPSSNTSSSENLLKIACDGTRYGKNLKVTSCRNVFQFVNKDERQFTFAERDSGVPFDVPLPLRTLSNDGLCFIQPVLKSGAISGKASSTEIGQAALTMLQTCVVERGVGGMAFNIGGDNNINVAIANYKPNIKCDSTSTPGPEFSSCLTIFVNMRASKQVRIFGDSEDPLIEERLPLTLIGSDENCQLEIDIEGPTTVASWYEIWEAVSAITSMCTRQKGKGGKAKGLGLSKNIRLELSATKDDPGEKIGNASIVSMADAGPALQDFDTVSSQAGLAGFDPDNPFELLAGGLQDNSSPVTLPGDSWANDSVIASA